MNENKKCIIQNRLLKPCRFLDERMDYFQNKSKGFRYAQFRNMNTHERTRDLVSYHMSSQDKGLVLNYCPFCGEELHKEFEEEEENA